ncbi:MAG: dienelactone hydrolase family protein [Rhodothermaceae bacterium]|nr:dienelactone hydrolase family protein [Rhodothermaceae bacterium]
MHFSNSSLKQWVLLVSLLVAVLSIPASSFLKGLSNTRSLEYNGVDRTYQVYPARVSSSSDKKPLIIALHDNGSSPRNLIRSSQGRINKLADEQGYVMVYPEGHKKSWDMSGSDAAVTGGRQRGDVGFIKMLIESLKKEASIDEERIFLTGMGAGGVLALQLACEVPDMFRAVAVVNGSILVQNSAYCDGSMNTSLLLMNGTENPIIPYEGGMVQVPYGPPMNVLSTEATLGHWLKKNGCLYHSEETLLPNTDPRDDTSVAKYNYSGCHSDVKVILYKVNGGGHTWPGGRQSKKEDRFGRMSRDLDGGREIWRFFEAF